MQTARGCQRGELDPALNQIRGPTARGQRIKGTPGAVLESEYELSLLQLSSLLGQGAAVKGPGTQSPEQEQG